MLKAGFARVDVTPPLGTRLDGYFSMRHADGVLDPLELNCVALSDGENAAVVLTTDFLYVTVEAAGPIREKISKAVGIDKDAVFINSLHQHTSSRIGGRQGMATGLSDTAYLDVLNRKFCDVVKMAMDDMCEAEVGVCEKETAEKISFIRRYRMKDGTTCTNPGVKNADKVVHPVGEADNTVRLVRFKREGKKDIALVNFQTHPDVVHGNKISADWPGFARRYTEKDINCHCILVNGPQGDTNHVNLYNYRDGYEHSAHMGRVIADVVVDIWDKTEKINTEGVSYGVNMRYIPVNTADMDRVEECKKLIADAASGKLDFTPDLNQRGEWNRISKLYDAPLFVKVPVSVVRAGSLAFVGFGGEPFTEYATKARESAPDKFVVCACLTNGGEGYLPSKSAYDEGGYEARSSLFVSDVAPILQDTAKEMLN